MFVQLDMFQPVTYQDVIHNKIQDLKEEMANVRRGIFQRVGEIKKVQQKEIDTIELIMDRLDKIERKIGNT
jgi:tetrahydromethanopterin S-methyltransferase subunit G